VEYCLKCNREHDLETGGISLFIYAQTRGLSPRLKSRAQRLSLCTRCAVSLAYGPSPEGALNVAAYKIIVDLVGLDRAVTDAAWVSLSRSVPELLRVDRPQLVG